MTAEVTIASLVAAGVGPTQARVFAAPLAAACRRFAITTPARIAAFLAQCRAESQNLTVLEENLYYTRAERIRDVFKRLRGRGLDDIAKLVRNPEALANAAYAGVNGNGDEASGDGWAFRGRGLIQLTGRANYADAAEALDYPYHQFPELAADPGHACLTAAWFWHSNKLNVLADSWQIDAITRAVNGPARMHADLRLQFSEEAVSAFAAA